MHLPKLETHFVLYWWVAYEFHPVHYLILFIIIYVLIKICITNLKLQGILSSKYSWVYWSTSFASEMQYKKKKIEILKYKYVKIVFSNVLSTTVQDTHKFTEQLQWPKVYSGSCSSEKKAKSHCSSFDNVLTSQGCCFNSSFSTVF